MSKKAVARLKEHLNGYDIDTIQADLVSHGRMDDRYVAIVKPLIDHVLIGYLLKAGDGAPSEMEHMSRTASAVTAINRVFAPYPLIHRAIGVMWKAIFLDSVAEITAGNERMRTVYECVYRIGPEPVQPDESWRRCDDCKGDECADGCSADQPRDEHSDEFEGAE